MNPQLLLPFRFLQKIHPWCALVLHNTHLEFLKDRRKFWAKRLSDKREYSNVLLRIFKSLSLFVVKPFGFLLLLEITHNEVSARKLSDLKKSILMRGLDSSSICHQKYERFEVHHGALQKKPLLIILSYFPTQPHK